MNLCCVNTAAKVEEDYDKRVKELESAIKRFINQAEEIKIRRGFTSLETVHLE